MLRRRRHFGNIKVSNAILSSHPYRNVVDYSRCHQIYRRRDRRVGVGKTGHYGGSSAATAAAAAAAPEIRMHARCVGSFETVYLEGMLLLLLLYAAKRAGSPRMDVCWPLDISNLLARRTATHLKTSARIKRNKSDFHR